MKKEKIKWDVTHEEALKMCEEESFYFDPELSYETSGYRPITETKGLDFDPAPFTEVGRVRDATGSFTNIPKKTIAHKDWWLKQYEYCINGFSYNGYRITNDHYFFLNFYTMLNASKITEAGSGVPDSRPSFWAEHYKYFHYIDLCRKLGFDSVLLKARAVGASETAASLGVRPFITIKNSKSLYTGFTEKFVKDILSKCWKQLNWLDMNSETGMRKLRQVVNSNFHKRASKLSKDNVEYGRMSEILGFTVDDPDKLRGDRVDNWFLEESGSNKVLLETYAVGGPLVIINGKRRGTRFVFGTGGCLCENSRVFTKSGKIVNIQDLKQEDGIVGHDCFSATKENINYMHEVSIKPCVRIVTKSGRELNCSTDHPIYSKYIRSTRVGIGEKTQFLEAGKLRVNDKIAIPRFIEVFGDNKYKFAEITGELIGSNLYSLKGQNNIDEIDSELMSDLISNNVVENGLVKQVVPLGVSECDRNSLANFIRGLVKSEASTIIVKKNFGELTRTFISIKTVSKDFAIDVMLLLQKIGVYSHLRKCKDSNTYNNIIWSIEIRDRESIFNLVNTIDVTGFYKLEDLKVKLSKKSFDKEPLIYDDVVYVEKTGYDKVYNLEASETHTYIGNGILTHNSEGPQLHGLKTLFLDPRAYSVLPYRNNFTASGEFVLTGFFIPAWATYIDAMDNRGVVNKEKAQAHYMKERAKLANDPISLIKYCAEFCFTHEEALSREGQNDFNQARLASQRSEIENLKRTPKPEKGYLHWVYKGKDSNEIAGVRWEPNSLGDIEITEHPLLEDDGFPIKNLYVGGIDSIDLGMSDSTEGKSKFCILIKKRTFGLGGNQYVCKYLKRPNDVREAYGTAARILWYYGCKANLEDTKIAFRTWLREKKWDNKMLMTRPVYALADGKRRNQTLWGTPASPKMIMHGLELVRDYIEDYCQNIYYIDVIDQLQKYSFEDKGNFDVVAAMCMAEIGDEDMYNLIARKNENSKSEWNDIGYYFDERGVRHFGIIPKSRVPDTDIIRELKKQGYQF